jgi:small subunit ribosomal protein S5
MNGRTVTTMRAHGSTMTMTPGTSRLFTTVRGSRDSPGTSTEASKGTDGEDSSNASDEDRELQRQYQKLFERFERAPSKQKKFLLNKALSGRVFDDGEEVDEKSEGGRNRALLTRVVDVNRTNKVTKGGDLTNFTAMVVVGNGDGVIGFATGKAAEVGPAIDKAYRKAARSLTYINRFDNHTIFHEVKAKYCKTTCVILPAPSGAGIVANDTVAAICELAGIKNIKAKIHGSHHPHNTVRAVFAALESVESPEDVATRTGATVYRI